jgi:hypothetical protein
MIALLMTNAENFKLHQVAHRMAKDFSNLFVMN